MRLTSDVSLRLDEFRGIRANISKPLLDATFNVSPALAHITKQASGQAKIRLCICINLKI